MRLRLLREEQRACGKPPQAAGYFDDLLLLPMEDEPELDDGLLLDELDGLLLELDGLEEPPAALEVPPFVAAAHSARLTEPSWFVSALLKSSFELDDEPPAADELPPAFFAAASNSERLSLPSWFVSALSKVSVPLDDDEEALPPAAEDDGLVVDDPVLPDDDEDGLLLIDELPPDEELLLESAAYAAAPAKASTEKATIDCFQNVMRILLLPSERGPGWGRGLQMQERCRVSLP